MVQPQLLSECPPIPYLPRLDRSKQQNNSKVKVQCVYADIKYLILNELIKSTMKELI